MSAGTVISGGFPGRIAREVTPNQKCEGCLHYDRQVGQIGACTIGDSPWKCGEGDAPDIGYAPITRGAGSYLPDMSNHGSHAPEVEPQHVGDLYGSGSTRPVVVHQVSLGEEHVHLVKSILERHAGLQKSQCLRCSMRGTHGTSPHNAGAQVCTCQPIGAEVIAKAIVSRMSNAQRAENSLDDITQWVRDVAKAGFRLLPRRADTFADVPVGSGRGDDRNGGHLRPIVKGGTLEKAIDNTKHSHIVTGRLAPHGVGASGRASAHRTVDKLDNQYGASAHTAARNPNFKPKTLKWEKTSAYGPGGHTAEAGHGTYVHEPASHGQHNMTYYPHGQGKEGALHGGSHGSVEAAHAAAQVHHQKTVGG